MAHRCGGPKKPALCAYTGKIVSEYMDTPVEIFRHSAKVIRKTTQADFSSNRKAGGRMDFNLEEARLPNISEMVNYRGSMSE
jgi:hypothetical protein